MVTPEFSGAWRALGDVLGVGQRQAWADIGADVRSRHQEPHRAYHVVAHVEAVLGHLERLGQGNDPVCGLAAFFHDVIYDPTAGDNEHRSALLAEQCLGALGLSSEHVTRTAEVIEATASHQSTGDAVVDTFLDADLAVLGAAPEPYQAYTSAIRFEYQHLDDASFDAGRSSVLRGFLEREHIFLTAGGRAAYEAAARRNLATELATLSP